MENKTGNTLWRPVEGNLMTRWSAEVNPDHILPEYPRPQMVRREWLNLNGLWEYAVTPIQTTPPEAFSGAMLVPFPVESALSGVKKPLQPDELLWYRRTFIVPDAWKGQKLLLHFGAVDWKTEVWVNRQKIGEHTGGYYPFMFEISSHLREGENELLVCVWDPTDTYGQERGKQVLKPSGIFYTAVSGIWQTVWMEPVPRNYIQSFKLTPDIDSEELTLTVHTAGYDNPESGSLSYRAIAFDDGKEIASGQNDISGKLTLKIQEPKLWSPDTPFLYSLKILLLNGGESVDEVQSYFGMRKFHVAQDTAGIKRLFLNNQPLFQNGVLDQGYWPDGLYTAPTDEALEYDIRMAKKLGFNMVRKHIKVEPARWYYHCDRLGLIVWQDMINGGSPFSMMRHLVLPNVPGRRKMPDHNYAAFGRDEESNRLNYKKELKEMLDTLYNVPSIGMWVPFNEGWGQFDAAEAAAWVKEYDPTRCVDHASGWMDQEAGDVISLHIYFKKLKLPKKTDYRAMVISEYGGYSLQEKGHVWHEDKEFGYKRFKSHEDLQAGWDSLIRSQLKPLIEQGLAAAVYTQLTDVETEINGLLTYDRAVQKVQKLL